MTPAELNYWKAYGRGCMDTEASMAELHALESNDLRAQVDRLHGIVIDLLDDDQAIRDSATAAATGLGLPQPPAVPLSITDAERLARTDGTVEIVGARRALVDHYAESWSDGRDYGPEWASDDEAAEILYASAVRPIPGSGEGS